MPIKLLLEFVAALLQSAADHSPEVIANVLAVASNAVRSADADGNVPDAMVAAMELHTGGGLSAHFAAHGGDDYPAPAAEAPADAPAADQAPDAPAEPVSDAPAADDGITIPPVAQADAAPEFHQAGTDPPA